MPDIDWYFDFISPFSYLQATRLSEFEAFGKVRRKPILLGALLKHWGHTGPAELAPKRRWTYEHCAWLADRMHVPLVFPAEHPFNPVTLLRASLVRATDGVAQPDDVTRIFRAVWSTGMIPGDAANETILGSMDLSMTEIDDAVKARLKANTDEAIGRGVFGVPSLVIDGQNFWGLDATDMALAFLKKDPLFSSPAWDASRSVPEGLQRRRAP